MLKVLVLHLMPRPAQGEALLQTMHSFNHAANTVAQIAFARHTSSIVLLQKHGYVDVREQFNLLAQLTMNAIGKAAPALKRDKNCQPVFEHEGAMYYDRKTLSFKGMETVSLLTLQGRIDLPFCIFDYQSAPLGVKPGQSYLFVVDTYFYLAAMLDVPDALPARAKSVLNGVDVAVLFVAEDRPPISSAIRQVRR